MGQQRDQDGPDQFLFQLGDKAGLHNPRSVTARPRAFQGLMGRLKKRVVIQAAVRLSMTKRSCKQALQASQLAGLN